ncbi:tagaturonate reductase [Aneurinibacillus sp. Ricciae_BoGa-3]|uniref:tagaturonate reductase n=1 Tax=Aneurinibacillus sp. Ricciae_BoGa-3 TaxID=3022697 RepID=UPI0023401083|nr:tagaturonate reductase [Aneurinibacillus sp. Ricciae_BoGa-3]WCK53198.1 tagaturonate reductase [Aneurinibacillus sp. Ricciae_BoGa-3]
MEKLSKELITCQTNSSNLPERILQFGEGNFLRGFVDWMVHKLNQQGLFNGRIVAVQPTPHGKTVPSLNAQNGLYTVVLRGIQNGCKVDEREVISSISRGINPYEQWDKVLEVASKEEIQLVFSNTTEAGMKYLREDYNEAQSPLSFPGKLTACLYHRFKILHGAPEAGWTIIPCELVENNGSLLRQTILQIAQDWNLPEDFTGWVVEHNRFCNTLVDRIVTGYPKDNIEQFRQELGYDDELLTIGEPYHLFVIDGDPIIRDVIPFQKAGLNVRWDDVDHFRKLKVRILNGAHTLMCLAGYLSGEKTVLGMMENPKARAFITNGIYDEILPTLTINEAEKESFASSVLERFQNPYTQHYLLDISLQSVSKFKTRLLPTLHDYTEKFGKEPRNIAYSLAALIVFYKGEHFEENQLIGTFGGQEYQVRDDEETIRFIYQTWCEAKNIEDVVQTIMENEKLWGCNMNKYPGLKEQVSNDVAHINTNGVNFDLLLNESNGKL